MTDLEVVEREIDRLEAKETTYYVCSRLATLYTIRDHLRPQASGDSAILPKMGGSDFLESVSGKGCKDVLKVLDEHLETIRLLYPKTYSSLVDKIREL